METAYPALVERALKVIRERPDPIAEVDLAAELFGAARGPWERLLGTVLGKDARLRRLEDGRWCVQGGTTPHEAEPVGLVVLAAGPKPWRHPIVAIGAARAGARFETLVRPEVPLRVPKYLEKLGVRAAQLEEAPPLRRAIEELMAFVGDAPLVGLDVGVAAARLQFALRRLGMPPLDNALVELAAAGDGKPELAKLARARGVVVPSRLTPAGLAELALKVASGEGSKSALGATGWRRLLDARLLADLPDAPGVYLFREASGRVLYVGKATSLRARLASYLTGSFPLVREMHGLIEAAARVEHEETACELAARMREAELIAAHRPPYNVQRQVGPALAYARLVLQGEADARGIRVPRLGLELGSEEPGVLAPVADARAAFSTAQADWWPARPRAAERPRPMDVATRFAGVSRRFEAELRETEVAPGLRARDLSRGLEVTAPVRPIREASEDEEAWGDWTRERRDEAWPPIADGGGVGFGDSAPAPPDLERDAPVTVEARSLPAMAVVLAALRRGEAGVSARARP